MSANTSMLVPTDARCVGAVLAGGASRRMGTDKAFITLGGVTMVERAVSALRQAGLSEVVVVGGDSARLDALGLPSCPDRHPGEGPLGGVITALYQLDHRAGPGTDTKTKTGTVVTLPCDVIEPDPAAVRSVLAQLADSRRCTDAVIPLGDGTPQWLHGAWRLRSRRLLDEAFTRGMRAPRLAAQELNIVMLDLPESGWFRDADLPADLPEGVADRIDRPAEVLSPADLPEGVADRIDRPAEVFSPNDLPSEVCDRQPTPLSSW